MHNTTATEAAPTIVVDRYAIYADVPLCLGCADAWAEGER